jgi:hypothetical protein
MAVACSKWFYVKNGAKVIKISELMCMKGGKTLKKARRMVPGFKFK